MDLEQAAIYIKEGWECWHSSNPLLKGVMRRIGRLFWTGIEQADGVSHT